MISNHCGIESLLNLHLKSRSMKGLYLESAKKQFVQYKTLGDKTFEQVPDEKLFWQYNPECNSMGSIVKHLRGNMLSRFTDFLTSDGEKQWRDREAEFQNDIKTREDLLSKWNEGWQCLFDAIDPLTEEDVQKTIFIRNEKHAVVEALNRQLTHYAYHVGQIVFLGKMICGNEWKSLSIPRGQSDQFNASMFSKPK